MVAVSFQKLAEIKHGGKVERDFTIGNHVSTFPQVMEDTPLGCGQLPSLPLGLKVKRLLRCLGDDLKV